MPDPTQTPAAQKAAANKKPAAAAPEKPVKKTRAQRVAEKIRAGMLRNEAEAVVARQDERDAAIAAQSAAEAETPAEE
jgi:hypothetical protein